MLTWFWWGTLREREIERPRRRWEDKIKMVRNRTGGMNWTYLAQDRDIWRALVSTLMNLRLRNCRLLKKNSVPCNLLVCSFRPYSASFPAPHRSAHILVSIPTTLARNKVKSKRASPKFKAKIPAFRIISFHLKRENNSGS